MTGAICRVLSVALILPLTNACSAIAPPYAVEIEKVCDVAQFEQIFMRPARGALRAGAVQYLGDKLERFLLRHETCRHSFTYEYFIDPYYSGAAPGLSIQVIVEYSKGAEPEGCVTTSFSSYCFNSQGRLELVQNSEN